MYYQFIALQQREIAALDQTSGELDAPEITLAKYLHSAELQIWAGHHYMSLLSALLSIQLVVSLCEK